MKCDLRMTEAQFLQLQQHCAPSFRKGRRCSETGMIGILGECNTDTKHEFLLVKLFPPGPGDLKVAEHDNVVFDASYIRRAHLEMRKQKLAGLIFFHTHPMADETVAFSFYDDQQEPLLVENLQELEPKTRVLSVVFGKSSQCGRIWHGPSRAKPLSRMIIVGETLSFRSLTGTPESSPPPPEAIFDRGLAVTDAGALGILSGLTIAVVGASGTGSLECELLARGGCKNIMPIDDDIVKDINLNRIFYATQQDVEAKTPKVEVIRRGIEGLGLGCNIEPIFGNILDRDVLNNLRRADVIIGCMDKGYPRQVLCEFAYRYHIPYIDIGTEIGGDKQGIVSLDARTSYIAPGRYCLQCAGVVTSRQLNFESVSSQERERVRQLGYSDDLVLKQPAVMDLNMRAASWGMMLLRHLLQPFLLLPLPMMILENMVTYSMKAIHKPKAPNSNCPICQKNIKAGYGDCGEPLGLDKETLRTLTEGE